MKKLILFGLMILVLSLGVSAINLVQGENLIINEQCSILPDYEFLTNDQIFQINSGYCKLDRTLAYIDGPSINIPLGFEVTGFRIVTEAKPVSTSSMDDVHEQVWSIGEYYNDRTNNAQRVYFRFNIWDSSSINNYLSVAIWNETSSTWKYYIDSAISYAGTSEAQAEAGFDGDIVYLKINGITKLSYNLTEAEEQEFIDVINGGSMDSYMLWKSWSGGYWDFSQTYLTLSFILEENEMAVFDIYNSSQINNFNATFTNTTDVFGPYSTTSGSIFFPTDSLVNITASFEGDYLSVLYTNVNLSDSLVLMVAESEIKTTAKDAFNMTPITDFDLSISGYNAQNIGDGVYNYINAGTYEYIASADGMNDLSGNISVESLEKKDLVLNFTDGVTYIYGPFNASEPFNSIQLSSDCDSSDAINVSRSLTGWEAIESDYSKEFDDIYGTGFYMKVDNNRCSWIWLDTMEALNATETQANIAIQTGIESALTEGTYTVYDNQQIYLRSITHAPLLAVVDKVVVSGNQRWILNYRVTSALGLFDISNVAYSLDMVNMSMYDIENEVRDLITSTKN